MSGALNFGEVTREPDVRLAEDMGGVILDKDWLKDNKKTELYYMYRDLWREGDKEKIRDADLRYDITIIPSLVMGKEYVKTKGHYHPETDQGVKYPEIYEVLSGRGHYLLQKKSSGEIIDVVLVKAKEGEKVLIPPGYGHITINPADEDLKMANWVNRTFDSIYGEIDELEGGAYLELLDGTFVKNENYDQVPDLREASPTEIPDLEIETGVDMYDLIKNPKNLDFLSEPKDYSKVFEEAI